MAVTSQLYGRGFGYGCGYGDGDGDGRGYGYGNPYKVAAGLKGKP